MLKHIVVSVIGSCRVYTPSNYFVESSNVELGHSHSDWFTHSTPEVIQKIRILNNELPLDKNLVPLIVRDYKKKYKPHAHKVDFFKKTDIFIVEISSVRSIKFNGYYLQQICFKEAKLSNDKVLHSFLDSVNIINMSETDMYHDLAIIHSLLGNKPMLLVTHNLLKKPDDTIAEERLNIKSALSKYADENMNVICYDPTEDILKYGLDFSMVDHNHYSKEFEKVMASAFLSRVYSLVSI